MLTLAFLQVILILLILYLVQGVVTIAKNQATSMKLHVQYYKAILKVISAKYGWDIEEEEDN